MSDTNAKAQKMSRRSLIGKATTGVATVWAVPIIASSPAAAAGSEAPSDTQVEDDTVEPIAFTG